MINLFTVHMSNWIEMVNYEPNDFNEITLSYRFGYYATAFFDCRLLLFLFTQQSFSRTYIKWYIKKNVPFVPSLSVIIHNSIIYLYHRTLLPFSFTAAFPIAFNWIPSNCNFIYFTISLIYRINQSKRRSNFCFTRAQIHTHTRTHKHTRFQWIDYRTSTAICVET